jgi:uncharacterized protein YdbL (DUF1318 family)
MTGPKTVIERQIIGDYKELNENSWMVSSVKTFSSEGTSSDKADTQLLAAFADRNKIADNVALYKKEGVLGEANTGYVAYISSNAYENNVSKKAALTDIIKKENTARGTIFKRTLFLSKNAEPTQSEIDAFGKSFAEEQAAKASKGEMVQDKSGAWKKK